MSADEQRDRFSLSDTETQQLRRALVGIEGAEPDPKTRWNRPSRQSAGPNRRVPDVLQRDLDAARRILEDAGFRTGDVTYQDNPAARGRVLNQYPDPGSEGRAGADVDLVVASGTSVRIPSVAGKQIGDAMQLLRRAGLEVEADVVFSASDTVPKNHVIEITPAPGTLVTPHTNAVLNVSSGAR
jgi:serine/threonine-protein kinase